MDVYTQFLHFALAILSIGVTALTPLVYKIVMAFIAKGESRISIENKWILDEFINTVVKAAEQNGLNGLLPDNAAKKAWAIKQVQDWLDARGLSINVAEIEAAIEAAIMDGVHKGEKPLIYAQGLSAKTTETTAAS